MIKKNLKKIDNNIYFYKETSSVSLIMNISFVFETSRINDLKAHILSDYLCTINSIYKTKKEITDKKSELYSPKLSIHTSSHNDKTILYFEYVMLDYKKVNDNYLDDAIKFASDMLFKPLFINNELDKDRFNIIKEDYYNAYINTVKEFDYESNVKYEKTVLKGQTDNIFIYDSKEDLRKDLDSITDKDIIDFYNMVLDNHYKTLFFGNYSMNDINKILKVFSFKNNKKYKIDYRENIELKPEYNEYISKNYTQSVLYFTYKNNNYEKYGDKMYSHVINKIVNGLDGFLYKKLRSEYGLVYHVSGSLLSNSNIFIIQADIDKKNKDKTIKAVKEVFIDVKNRDKISKRLDHVKELIKENFYLSSERPIFMYYDVCNYLYENVLYNKSYITKINKITVDDIIEFFTNLEDENIFFYIGDKNE